MSTIAEIILDAYQLPNIVALGETATAEEEQKALRYVNRIFKSLFGNELGGQLVPVQVTNSGIKRTTFELETYKSSDKLHPNERVLCSITRPLTLNLPAPLYPGAQVSVVDTGKTFATHNLTLRGDGATIENAATRVLSTNGFNGVWFFRDDLGNWQRISDLTLTDEFPLPEEFEEVFISLLGTRLTASVSAPLTPQAAMLMKEMVRKLKARYKQRMPLPSDVQSYKAMSWYIA